MILNKTSQFYNKFIWEQIAPDNKVSWKILREDCEVRSGKILRTIYCQFGKWCVEKGYRFGDDDFTKLFWFKKIVPYLCHENPCVKVLRGHTHTVVSVVKLNETKIVSGSSDRTLRIWDITKL